jgi:hypothetical protein
VEARGREPRWEHLGGVNTKRHGPRPLDNTSIAVNGLASCINPCSSLNSAVGGLWVVGAMGARFFLREVLGGQVLRGLAGKSTRGSARREAWRLLGGESSRSESSRAFPA